MSLVIAGKIVPMSTRGDVAPSEDAAFRGRVWIGDDGSIAAVTKGTKKGPANLADAREIDVGTSLVMPGLIDLHSHLAYATLPLWVDGSRKEPFAHHDSWPSRPSYAPEVTWPAYAFITAAPAELLAYAEVRALIGGTTSIQGSPPSNRPLDGWLVRNVEDERLKGTLPSNRIMASTLTLKPDQLGTRARQMANDGVTFIYHCAEGRQGTIVAREYETAQHAGCLQANLVAIHTNALPPAAYGSWNEPGTVVWSPFSNLWLYGPDSTVDVPKVSARRIRVCIGSDWGPSGTRNVLGELKVADLVSKARGWGLSPFELVKMVTANPGDVLARAWGCGVGRLEPGALADVVVISSANGKKPFDRILGATERDIQLVLIGGVPLYGTEALMKTAGAKNTSSLRVHGEARALALTRFRDSNEPWTFAAVSKRLEQVRANPKQAIEAARARAYAEAERGDTPLRLGLDMPTGKVPVGGLPKDLGQLTVPPIQPLEHDAAFFASIRNRGFHGGILDGLEAYYAGG